MQNKRIKEQVTLLTGLCLIIAVSYLTGIGCPIKWLTGIPCAGCGLTRACLSALQLQFQKAFYYHPLFFTVPFIIIFCIFREKLPDKLTKVMMWTAILAFIIVYIIRFLNPDCDLIEINLKEGLIGRIIRSILP